MKKAILFAALGLIVLAGCTTSDEVFQGPDLQKQALEDNAITFGTYMGGNNQTRAGYTGNINTDVLKDNAKANGFGVFAYYTGTAKYTDYRSKTLSKKYPNFMYNEHVYYDEGNTEGYITHWKYDIMKYWPNEVASGVVDDQDNDQSDNQAYTEGTNGGNLSFFAYAPYVEVTTQSQANETAGGKVSSNTSGIVALSGNEFTGNGTRYSDPFIKYVIPADGSAVVDLLWGTNGGTSVNVKGNSNVGVTGTSESPLADYTVTSYPAELLNGYTTNADLTKQKTNGTVNFAFKHATSKVGGSTQYTETTGAPTNYGLMVVLDIDDQKGAESGGSKADATKVTISEVSIEGRSLVNDGTNNPFTDSYTETYLKNNQGFFNLATGKWELLSDDKTTTTSEAATTTHKITVDGTDAAGKLNETIAEPNDWKSTWSENPEGVLTTAKNVYQNEAAPLVFIPGTWPELTITVKYFVRTEDSKLAGGYSYVPQVIKKKVTFKDAVELNKQYSLLMHLGLTSVKFTATVSGWDLDNDNPNYDSDNNGVADIEVIDAYLPINVADAAAVVHATSTFKYTASTPGSNAYTPHGTTTIDGSTVNYTISKTEAVTSEDGHNYIINDLARYIGSIWRIDNGETVKKITYDSKAYVWNSAGTNKGSNWVLESNGTTSLVSQITYDLSSWLTSLSATDTNTKEIKLYLNDNTTADPITINVKVTI